MNSPVPFLLFLFPFIQISSQMSVFTFENLTTNSYLSRLFPFESTNIQEMANFAMNPILDNQTLIQMFSEASLIVNVTGADSVLLELDPKSSQKMTNFTSNDNKNNSLIVLAVTNPKVPSHEDLMKKFNYYFVNLTESPLKDMPTNGAVGAAASGTNSLPIKRPTMWQIFVDFIRNQMNAILGAMMIPINVSANAILKSTQTHAEYVMSGSSFGSVVSAPIILKAISVPNIVSQKITDVAAQQVNNIESMSQQTKLMADSSIQMVASGLNNGTTMLSDGATMIADGTDQYVIRPIGAFTGFNLDRAGTNIAAIGKSFANTGLNIHLFSERLGSDAVKMVSAGATAIAWGLDDTVSFKPNKRQI